MSTSTRSGYHHGDLRATALASAMQLLEAGEPFSLRAVARDVGVSAPALYRHFTDRDALESALAAQGLRDLLAALTADRPIPSTATDLGELAVTYVQFALRRPALFRVMFGNACDEGNEQRVEAAEQIHQLLAASMGQVFPAGDATALADAGWAFAHGMACLYLDGKLVAPSAVAVGDHVRTSFAALLAVREPGAERRVTTTSSRAGRQRAC